MKSFFKNFFKNKNSKISFNQKTQSFIIEDNAKAQIWFLRVLMMVQCFSMFGFLYKSEEIDFLFLIVGTFFFIILVLSFVIISAERVVYLDQIKHLIYRKNSSSATLGIVLKNRKRRNLYTYQPEGVEEMVNLFRENGVFIKEKSFLLS
ncbi:hypothetical protein LX97_02071 [Nonlabens dokdonensis]|jgi:hypothetical protein|uniref:Uncharacterized protein n=2 Tax=Nonlabens dokdonensis TaxID=328515 RepID=L7WC08_NONDD|nr:hypothetical protein [Nonlabens dokdonensis]AGC77747.1 hypothetical protein DDD_2620 [Nonlabens dokdonensis DSW-6]PZX39717.1 hypothetical protein LX97_02071 [Nonlabens dokdonensis]